MSKFLVSGLPKPFPAKVLKIWKGSAPDFEKAKDEITKRTQLSSLETWRSRFGKSIVHVDVAII